MCRRVWGVRGIGKKEVYDGRTQFFKHFLIKRKKKVRDGASGGGRGRIFMRNEFKAFQREFSRNINSFDIKGGSYFYYNKILSITNGRCNTIIQCAEGEK